MTLDELRDAVAAMTEGPWTSEYEALSVPLGRPSMGFPVEATRRTIGILGQTLPDNATADATGIVALRNAAPALLRLAAAAVAWGKAEPFVHERGGMERLVKAEVALRAALADPLLHESQP